MGPVQLSLYGVRPTMIMTCWPPPNPQGSFHANLLSMGGRGAYSALREQLCKPPEDDLPMMCFHRADPERQDLSLKNYFVITDTENTDNETN